MQMLKEIWLVRHGESIANAGAATQDHITISLSKKGQEQANQISLLVPYQPDLIVTSPFIRTHQTAEPILKRFPGAKHEVWEVQEFTYLSPPTCAGTTAAERYQQVNEFWERSDPDYVDGPGAESFRQFITRAQAACDRLSRLSEGFILMFTHAQFIRAMRLLKGSNERDIHKLMSCFRELPRANNCEITKWETTKNRTFEEEIKRIKKYGNIERHSPPGVTGADLEKDLPPYLQHDIDALIEGEKNKSTLLDCLWGEVYGSINSAEVDLLITFEQAAYLRKKYLYGDE